MADAIALAPRPNVLAKDLLKHLEGEGKKKFSSGVFHNPTEQEYDAFGYLCWMIGLNIEVSLYGDEDDRYPICTGYASAPDQSRELITLIGNTVLGYNPKRSSSPLPTPYAADAVHLFSGLNPRMDINGTIDPDDFCPEIDPDIYNREIPFDIAYELKIIADGDRDPLPYGKFEPTFRPLEYQGRPYALRDQRS